MALSEVIAKRKSIRAYLDKPVAPEDVATIVEAGQWGPNAGPFTLSVIRNAALLKRINDMTSQSMLASGNDFLVSRASLPGYQPLYSAPLFIVISGPTDAPYSALNAAVSAENMLLQATDLGLGSCFIRSAAAVLNAPQNRALAEEAGIPEGSEMQCGVVVGYTEDEDKFRARPRESKGTVIYID